MEPLCGEPHDTDHQTYFHKACEYDDFREFLENELGIDYFEELWDKFEKQNI
jgi:hypothetical protein